jgi:hypothetical protein
MIGRAVKSLRMQERQLGSLATADRLMALKPAALSFCRVDRPEFPEEQSGKDPNLSSSSADRDDRKIRGRKWRKLSATGSGILER